MYAFVVIESIKVIVLQIVVRWLNVEITNIAKKKGPLWLYNCHNGMCLNCAIQMRSHKITNQVE